jgi:hypothetical protein
MLPGYEQITNLPFQLCPFMCCYLRLTAPSSDWLQVYDYGPFIFCQPSFLPLLLVMMNEKRDHGPKRPPCAVPPLSVRLKSHRQRDPLVKADLQILAAWAGEHRRGLICTLSAQPVTLSPRNPGDGGRTTSTKARSVICSHFKRLPASLLPMSWPVDLSEWPTSCISGIVNAQRN